MGDLERISLARIREAKPGRMRHAPRETLTRHLQDHTFAAIVLSGGYVEAGDTGRHWMRADDVLLHQAWQGHLDRFGGSGADVLALHIADVDARWLCGRITDPDALARLPEQDCTDATHMMFAQLMPKPMYLGDWPDELVRALRDDSGVSLGAWASEHDLRLGSFIRGFR